MTESTKWVRLSTCSNPVYAKLLFEHLIEAVGHLQFRLDGCRIDTIKIGNESYDQLIWYCNGFVQGLDIGLN